MFNIFFIVLNKYWFSFSKLYYLCISIGYIALNYKVLCLYCFFIIFK